MRSPKNEARRRRMLEKADYLFMVYRFMGPDRSLANLHEMCVVMGIRISKKRLQAYSSEFNWQRRLLELNAEDMDRREKGIAAQVEQMNTAHAQFARRLLSLAVAGLTKFQGEMRETPQGRALNMSLTELTTLYRAAQAGERLARGQATSRVEVWVELAATIVREFALIFLAVNEIEDKIQRKAEYIRLSDDMMRRYYTEASRHMIGDKPGTGGFDA